MNPITLKIDDVPVTLKSIQKNKVYSCNCKDVSVSCNLKQQLSMSHSADTLVATEAIFNVRNTTSERWPIQLTDWELVDTDGYAYKARALCDALCPVRTIKPTLSMKSAQADSYVTPGTQVDFVLVFPELEKDKEIGCILFSEQGMFHAFEIQEMKPETADLLRAREDARIETLRRELHSRRFEFGFKQLERKIHARLTKTLTGNKPVELEDDIERIIFQIKQDLEFKDERTRKAVEERLMSVTASYESELLRLKAEEEERKKLDQTVEGGSKLSALEFEKWFADLLENLGYKKVHLTPPSNDEGIDILAENKGLKVAVQCKHWKKSKVGRPEVVAFLGAIQHAQVKRGMLVTTGLFTEGARKMADEHPIQLIGGSDLANWIQEVRQK